MTNKFDAYKLACGGIAKYPRNEDMSDKVHQVMLHCDNLGLSRVWENLNRLLMAEEYELTEVIDHIHGYRLWLAYRYGHVYENPRSAEYRRMDTHPKPSGKAIFTHYANMRPAGENT